MFAQQTVAEITLLSFSVGTFALLLLNCATNISPITGIWLILYLTTILILSIWITSMAIQKLLGQNKPLKYDLSIYSNKYPILKVFSSILPKIPIASSKSNVTTSKKDYDTAELSIISTVIERKLVSSWYKNFVSEEIGFPFACKQLLDGMINKGFQISSNIDTISLSTDIMAVTLKHYKEYYRAQKRQERAAKGNLEDYYKAQHPTFSTSAIRNKKYTTTQHCYLVIRVILKELLPWELWDTPHSDLLVSILAKKLDEFLKKNLCDPIWIHRVIQSAIRSAKTEEADAEIIKPTTPVETESNIETSAKLTMDKQSQLPSNETITKTADDVKVKDVSGLPKATVTEASIQSALSHLISKSTAPILQRAELDVPVVKNGQSVPSNSSTGTNIPGLKTSDPVDILNSPRHRKQRKNGDHVKIHDRIMEGSVRTWNSDVDLECVSLGQDLLANFDGEMTLESRLGRLWEADNLEATDGWSPNPPVSSGETKSPQTLWFGEEDTIEPEAQEGSPVQQSNDEAAGVMEGILDLGIAGLRKGLRLTGLHETQQEMKNLLAREKIGSEDKPGSGRVTPCDTVAARPEVPTKKTPSGKPPVLKDEIPKKVEHAAPTCSLVKQARVSSQDSVASVSEPLIKPATAKQPPAQPVSIAELVADSPELEYEDPADFASTIAKLRCLLQQKGSDGTASEDSTTSLDKTSPAPGTSPSISEMVSMPLETIKEAKGKPDNFFSLTKPIDHATFAGIPMTHKFSSLLDEYDLPVHRSHIPGPTAAHNNMQRLDRLFQRTVTGVFNSIKTVVGAEGGSETITESSLDGDQLVSVPLHKNTLLSDNWLFVESDADMSSAVGRLVGERRSFCLVEPGQDTLETLASPPSVSAVPPPIDDDLEDLVNGCALWAGLLELAAAILGGRHVLLHCMTILLADKAEFVLEQQLNNFTDWCRMEIFNVFERMQQKTAKESKCEAVDEQESALDTGLTIEMLFQQIPTNIIAILGEPNLRSALKDLVHSVNNASTNQDLAFQVLDVLAVHFTRAAALRDAQCTMTPPPSA